MWSDRQTDTFVIKLIVAFRNFMNVSKNLNMARINIFCDDAW